MAMNKRYAVKEAARLQVVASAYHESAKLAQNRALQARARRAYDRARALSLWSMGLTSLKRTDLFVIWCGDFQ